MIGLNNGFFNNNRHLLDNSYPNSNLESLNEYSQLKAKNKFSNDNGDFVDYYKILSLDKSCSLNDVKEKYKNINDTLSSLPGVDPKLRDDINTAYDILSNRKLRKEYDQLYDNLKNSDKSYLMDTDSELVSDVFDDEPQGRKFGFFNFDDSDMSLGDSLFGNFFNNLFGLKKNKQEKPNTNTMKKTGSGINVSCNADIDLKTFLFGGFVQVGVRKFVKCNLCNLNNTASQSYIEKCKTCDGKGMEVNEHKSEYGYMRTSRTCLKCQGTGFRRLKDCSNCENTGKVLKDTSVMVKVPSNFKLGSVIKLKGMGNSGGFLREDGDIYVKLNLKEDKNEYMDGSKIITVYNIPYTKAILGGKVIIPTFIGDKEVEIPQYSQQGDEIKVGRYNKLDHYVRLNVQLPKNLSDEELEQLRKKDEN